MLIGICFGILTSCSQLSKKNMLLKTKIDNYIKQNESSGFSGAVLVAEKGEILLNKGYGLADKDNNILNTPNTVFDIGSNSKQFTGTAILKLLEMNKLKLDDPVSKYFNALPTDKENITIHQLLTHTSGLLSHFGGSDFNYIPRDEFFKKLFETELMFEPGSKYSYSNPGFSILGRIIEIASNQEYEKFLNDYLFSPAGMINTGFLIPNWKNEMLATGYQSGVRKMGTTISRYKENKGVSWVLKGNGGINSTQMDMYKWYEALKENKILTKSLFEKLTTKYHPGSGYGWGISQTNRNTKRINHLGGNPAFSNVFTWLLEEDVVVLFSSNSNSTEIEEIALRVEKVIFNESYVPAPIKKPIMYSLYQFIDSHKPIDSKGIKTILREEYGPKFNNANVLNRLAYGLLRDESKVEWALELFKLNTEYFPNDPNVWDSYGDGYKQIGDKKKAIASYNKALQIDSDFKSSINSLEALGVKVKKTKVEEFIIKKSILEIYVGKYQMMPGFILDVYLKDGLFRAKPSGRPEVKLIAKSIDTFTVTQIGLKIRFNKSEDNDITSLTAWMGGREILGKRL